MPTQIIHRSQIDQAAYGKLLEQHDDPNVLYAHPLWLDAVCQDDWWVVVEHNRKGQYLAALSFYISKIGPLTFVGFPFLTPELPILGPKEYHDGLLAKLWKTYHNKVMGFALNYPLPTGRNWEVEKLERKRLTISLAEDYSSIAENFHSSLQGQLKKAQKSVFVKKSAHFNDFLEQNVAMLLSKKSLPNKKRVDQYVRLHHAFWESGKAFFLEAVNEKENVLSSLFGIRYNGYCLELSNFTNDQGRKARAFALLRAASISSQVPGKRMNFQGGNIPSLFEFGRKYGTDVDSYYVHVYRKKGILRPLIQRIWP